MNGWMTRPTGRLLREEQAFIAAASPLAEVLTEDPVQVMFNGAVAPMRALAWCCARAGGEGVSVAITGRAPRLPRGRQRRGCSKDRRWQVGGGTRDPARGRDGRGDNLNDIEMFDFAGTRS